MTLPAILFLLFVLCAIGGTVKENSEPQLGSGLIDHSQKMTVAAMAMADIKVWAQRS